jgi:hypothetical protein
VPMLSAVMFGSTVKSNNSRLVSTATPPRLQQQQQRQHDHNCVEHHKCAHGCIVAYRACLLEPRASRTCRPHAAQRSPPLQNC